VDIDADATDQVSPKLAQAERRAPRLAIPWFKGDRSSRPSANGRGRFRWVPTSYGRV